MTSNQHGPAVVEKAAPPQFTLLQLLVCLSLIGIVLGACRLATHLDPAAAALVAAIGVLSVAIASSIAAPRSSMWKGLSAAVGCCVVFALLAVDFRVDYRTPSKRLMCQNNLRNIAQVLLDYHDRKGSFPPAYVADKSGRPMHSWRVLILAELDPSLHQQYRFDEPWDGPHNSKLAKLAKNPFRCPSQNDGPQGSEHETSYVVIVGPKTAFPDDKCVALSDITDDHGNTILVVEVANCGIHWMEPRDLHVTQMAPHVNSPRGQGISSKHRLGPQVVMADGTVRILPPNTEPDVLRQLLGIDDGGTWPMPRER